jgi:hypothetical protein
MIKYCELVEIPPDSYKEPIYKFKRAYRIGESLDTFKLFLEYLARDTPQPPGLPPLWNLDQKKAEDLLDFAKKWDMDELKGELWEFLKPYYGYQVN